MNTLVTGYSSLLLLQNFAVECCISPELSVLLVQYIICLNRYLVQWLKAVYLGSKNSDDDAACNLFLILVCVFDCSQRLQKMVDQLRTQLQELRCVLLYWLYVAVSRFLDWVLSRQSKWHCWGQLWHSLSNANVLVVDGTWAIKLTSNTVRQFLTGNAR